MASLPSLEPPQTRAVVLDIGKGPEREMAPGPYPVVEMRGIEPLSENQSTQASPGAVGLLRFPRRIAVRQAMQFGSPQYNHALRGARTDRSPLIDAPSAAVVLRGGTAA
jgi:hypothetical protein